MVVRIKKVLIFCSFLLTIFIALAIYLWLVFPHRALSNHSDSLTYRLLPGTSLNVMSTQLKEQQVFGTLQAICFKIWVRLQRADKSLQAGEYAIARNTTPHALLNKVRHGEVIQHVLVLKEGTTFEQLNEMLLSHPAISHRLQGKSIEQIRELLQEPLASLEGLFYPDSYFFVHGTSDIELLKRARKNLYDRLLKAWQGKAPELALKTPYQALILASIIEKETALNREKPDISGVFQRRLKKGMRLQADPTVHYAFGQLQGKLTKLQLKTPSPFNTYLNTGLPPAPICFPSMSSLEAACHPALGETLYFVSKGDGSHHFSETLAEHNEAVQKYRNKEKTDEHKS